MGWWPNEEARARLETWGLWPCGNCGRKHYGLYNLHYDYEYGYEADFVWCSGTGPGQEKLCENGHRRDPCAPSECTECWLKARREQPVEAH